MKEPRFSQTTGQVHGQSRNRELTQYRELVNGRSLASVKFIFQREFSAPEGFGGSRWATIRDSGYQIPFRTWGTVVGSWSEDAKGHTASLVQEMPAL
jgi:hypothetical protein